MLLWVEMCFNKDVGLTGSCPVPVSDLPAKVGDVGMGWSGGSKSGSSGGGSLMSWPASQRLETQKKIIYPQIILLFILDSS